MVYIVEWRRNWVIGKTNRMFAGSIWTISSSPMSNAFWNEDTDIPLKRVLKFIFCQVNGGSGQLKLLGNLGDLSRDPTHLTVSCIVWIHLMVHSMPYHNGSPGPRISEPINSISFIERIISSHLTSFTPSCGAVRFVSSNTSQASLLRKIWVIILWSS